MYKNREKMILFIYLSSFLIFALTLACLQPISNTPPFYANPPDEHARILIPKYICKYGHIPTGFEEEIRIPGYGFSYGLYNVFPYIVQGYVMRIVHFFTDSFRVLLYSVRFVNVMFGFLMALVVYKLGKRIFEDDRFRWLFCFGVTFLPQNIFIHTYINTDSCCMLSTAMMLYGLVCCYKDGINRKNSVWMSVGIILCALSYYNAYGYILSCIMLFVAYFIEKRDGRVSFNWKAMIRWGILISSIVLVGILWWFIRAYIVLDGDFLGLKTREKLAELYAVDSVNPLYMQTYQQKGYTIWEMFREKDTLKGAFYSFVAMYGSMSILAGRWIYWGYELFFGFGIVGCFCRIISWVKAKRMSGKAIFFHLNMFFCIFMPIFLMIYYAYTMDYQHQGRYLLPALIPFIYYMVKGLQQLASFQWKGFAFSRKLITAGAFIGIIGIWGACAFMIYRYALPYYFLTGVV